MEKRSLRVVLLLLAVAVVPSLALANDGFGRMTVQEVAKKRGTANVFVYDNNSSEVFASGHVPGAKWDSPMSLKASDLPTDKAATLIFYCANEQCTACHNGATAALKLGYKNVFIMPEGIAGWKKAGLPVEKV